MSIYEREYAQEKIQPPTLVRNFTALEVLIGVNVVVFFVWLGLGRSSQFMHEHFVFSLENAVDHWRIHTALTSAISHFEVWHLLFNMVFLWWLGRDMELLYGPKNFLWMYVACALLASFTDGVMTAVHFLPDHGGLGASGAVMGIMVCCAFFYPNKPMYFMMLFRMPLKWLAILYVFLDLAMGFDRENQDGIGHFAHLGGALGGFLFYKFDLRLFASHGDKPRGILKRLQGLFRSKPKLRIVERSQPPQERTGSPSRSSRVDALTAERVDMLLKKISEKGIGSLTDEERAFLEASSAKYRS
ncbi:MAG: rhomboid family intramembrane serine protease [Planctomycetota bacterium]|nr:rhomboid family intramembrane serine protease [Planctomycetota bacterium]